MKAAVVVDILFPKVCSNVKEELHSQVYILVMSCGTPIVYYLGIEENRQQAREHFSTVQYSTVQYTAGAGALQGAHPHLQPAAAPGAGPGTRARPRTRVRVACLRDEQRGARGQRSRSQHSGPTFGT